MCISAESLCIVLKNNIYPLTNASYLLLLHLLQKVAVGKIKDYYLTVIC